MWSSNTLLSQSTLEIEKDYLLELEGYKAAELDYSGSGALIGGLFSGAAFGLIGWGLGYLIVRGMKVQVPSQYTSGLTAEQKKYFEDGYSSYVGRKRRTNFNTGGGIGTLVGFVYVMNQLSDKDISTF
ncbi:hypothetical protein JYT44_02280 [Caldithrix abyssi]|nr:hypothetical protein [Caldithrix abyssi]